MPGLFPAEARRRPAGSRPRRGRRLAFESLEGRRVMSADIFVAMNGSDAAGSGTLAAPFATLAKALGAAAAGDTVVLRSGTYAGGVRVDLPNITIRSQAGEWAVITAPTDIEDIDTVLSFNVDASGGRLQRLELVGGYYYAVKTETTFDWGPPTPQYGASQIVIEDCRIHDTGRDCIKITPDCDDVTIRRCEIYNSGRRDPGNAEGIDNVNGDRMIVQDCFIHDIATNGLYAKGGSTGSVIERNLIKNVGLGGIMVGFYTDAEYFDTGVNPGYYENIDCVVRNNIIVDTEGAGIGLYAALNPRIVGNTLVNVAQSSQAALLLNTTQIYFGEEPDPLRVPCRDVLLVDNIVTQSAGSSRPMFQIRLDQDGTVPMDALAGSLTIGDNRFFREGGTAQFVDDRMGRDYDGDLTGWSALIGSVAGSEGSPGLDANLHLAPGSPCIDAGRVVAGLTDDYDGNPRPAAPDIGADEAGAGTVLQVPPPAGTVGTRGTTVETPPRAPTAVALSATTVAENLPAGTVVGMLSTTDPDAGDTFRYSIVPDRTLDGTGLFEVFGNQLRTRAAFNFEAKSTYFVRVRSTDAGGLHVGRVFTITVGNVNDAPTAVALSAATVAENLPADTVVGALSTIDPDVGDTFRYVIVPDRKLDGTGLFEIVGNQLRTRAAFNFEAKSTYSVRVRSTDAGGLHVGRVFTIRVTDVNEAPTGIMLMPSTVAGNQPAGTVVGTLSTTDPDADHTFRYLLVADQSLDGTAVFEIVGNQLRTRAVFNAAVKSSYSVRVRSTDQGGLFVGRVFTITVGPSA